MESERCVLRGEVVDAVGQRCRRLHLCTGKAPNKGGSLLDCSTQALFDNKEYSRAASLIKSRNCARRNYKFATLLGRCLLESKAYGECLALIGGEDDQEELGIPLDDAVGRLCLGQNIVVGCL